MRKALIPIAAVIVLAACSGERGVVVDNTLPGQLASTTVARPTTTRVATTLATGPVTTGPTTTKPGTSVPAATTARPSTPTTPTVLGTSIVAPATTAPAGSGCAPFGTLATVTYNAAEPPSGLVGTDIRAGAHDCYDRVVIEFGPHGPGTTFPGYDVHYTSNPVTGDGLNSVTVKGGAALRVRVNAWMPNPDSSGYSGPSDIIAATTTHVLEMHQVDNFEGVTVWAIGIDEARPVRVTRLDSPARLVIDVFTG
jgi:hypothetical protein